MMLLVMGLFFPLAYALSYNVPVSTATRIYIPCYNATSGENLGSSATLNLWDSAGNKDVDAQAMTNVEAGLFYYSINLPQDIYSGWANCPTGAVDTPVIVYVSNTNKIPSDIETQLDDIQDRLRNESDFKTDTSTLATFAQLNAEINALNDSLRAYGDSNWVTATGFTTKTDINNLNASLRAYGDSNWATATGFSTHSATDVWAVGTRTLTAFSFEVALTSATETQIDDIQQRLRNTSDFNTDISSLALQTTLLDVQTRLQNESDFKADVSSLATFSQLNSEINALNDSLRAYGNSNWATATGFSTHSATDVWSVPTRTLTTADWTVIGDLANLVTFSQLNSKINSLNDSLQSYGDSQWSTADTSALCLESSVQAIGFDVNTSLVNQGIIQANFSDIVTLDEIDTRLNSSHGEGNWTEFVVTVDVSSITATVNATQIWEEVINDKCSYNVTTQSGSAAQLLCELWSMR